MRRYRVEVWAREDHWTRVLLGIAFVDAEDAETAERRGSELVQLMNRTEGRVEAKAEVTQ